MEQLMSIHGQEYIFPGHDAPHSDPNSVPFVSTINSGAQEAADDDDWEYEYSTTETEVLTAQLALKNMADPLADILRNSRTYHTRYCEESKIGTTKSFEKTYAMDEPGGWKEKESCIGCTAYLHSYPELLSK